jgi:hypothetical protein
MKRILIFAGVFAAMLFAAPTHADPCCEAPEDTYCLDCGPICGGYVDELPSDDWLLEADQNADIFVHSFDICFDNRNESKWEFNGNEGEDGWGCDNVACCYDGNWI